jgi:hypothetical protein
MCYNGYSLIKKGIIMAYMNQAKKAIIASKLKPVFKKYGVKGSLKVNNHSTIVLTVKSGKIDFIKNYNSIVGSQPGGFRNGSAAEKYLNINPYWYQEHFSGQPKEFLTEALTALKGADWYDESDGSIDYFNTAYYVDIAIGKWNKPYIVE